MEARRGSPVYRLRLMYGDAPVQVTVIGADAATAEDAADLLTDLLTRWNLDDPRSALSKLWRAGAAAGVGDATLLLLHLGTTARVDLRAGAVTLPTPTAPPDPDLVRALAVDIVVQDLLDNEAVGACVAIGSHIRVAGAAPTSAGWLVPGPPPGLSGRVRLHDGAMVTVERAYGESRRAVTAAMPTAWAAAAAAVAALVTTGQLLGFASSR
ncbi:MAG: hypothetical protein M3P23_01645 [Actinomycetota bacterium]|nr:hypothetical protein [Actinomycetota bacterium]